MNGEAMMLIVFGIAVIVLLFLILMFLIINPIRNAKMISQALLKKLSPASLVDGETLTDYANNSLDESIGAAHSLGANVAKLAIQRGVVEGVNLGSAQILNTHPEVDNRSEENPDGDLVKGAESDENNQNQETN